jgi:formiminotetrahydrofolate cyclodeaminase
MPKTLRQRIEELQTENEELQAVIDEYEEKFDAIAEQLPQEEEEEQD